MDQTNETSLFDLQIDAGTSLYLKETAKWAKFLSILGFIMCGLIVLAGIFFGTLMTSFSKLSGAPASQVDVFAGAGGVMAAILYIGFAALYFLPCLYLFNFANKMLKALRETDQQNLMDSFKNLRAAFRFVGILTIIVLSIYALVIVVALIVAAAAH
jgi:hypothetical protein